jgi:hypothetical protein
VGKAFRGSLPRVSDVLPSRRYRPTRCDEWRRTPKSPAGRGNCRSTGDASTAGAAPAAPSVFTATKSTLDGCVRPAAWKRCRAASQRPREDWASDFDGRPEPGTGTSPRRAQEPALGNVELHLVHGPFGDSRQFVALSDERMKQLMASNLSNLDILMVQIDATTSPRISSSSARSGSTPPARIIRWR